MGGGGGVCERGEGLVETGVGVEDNPWKSALVGLPGRAAQGLKGALFFSWGRKPGPGTPSWTPGQVKAIFLHILKERIPGRVGRHLWEGQLQTVFRPFFDWPSNRKS